MGPRKRMGIIGNKRKRVVVVGCGFGGVSLVRRLARRLDPLVELTAFDTGSDLYNYTILPRTLVESIPQRRVTAPLADLFRGLPISLRIERVEGVDADRATLHTRYAQLQYDYLVLATGSRAIPLERDDASDVLYPKSARHLSRLRDHITQAAAMAADQDPRHGAEAAYRFAIVGGGLTGIEFAIAVREALDAACARQHVSHRSPRVEIFEQASRLLPASPERFSHHLQAQLEATGIGVRLNTHVHRVEEQRLVVDGHAIAADAVLCCIGNNPNLRFEIRGLGDTLAGIRVNACLQSTANERVLAIGDSADLAYRSGDFSTRFASQAIRQGKLVAENIRRLLSGMDMRTYSSAKPPVGVMLGTRMGSFEFGGWYYTGRLAGSMKRYLETHW